MDDLKPASKREATAVFRANVIGALGRIELNHGELRERLVALSQIRFRLPGADRTRTFSVPTLERWYYAYRKDGLEGLKPKTRDDRGHAKELSPELRALLLDIRRVHPSASAELIFDTLVEDGRLAVEKLSVSTLRRLYKSEGLERKRRRKGDKEPHREPGQRLRWQASHPMALWQGDVCHGPAILIGGVSKPLRIHAIIDDASRYVVALEAHHSEREMDMVGMLAATFLRWGEPGAIYLDNGSTYRGEALATSLARLKVGLIHSKPYEPESRGKIERFFGTLRSRCLDHLDNVSSLHDVNVRLHGFLDAYYHDRPHAGLMGKTPRKVFMTWWRAHSAEVACEPNRLRQAFCVRTRRHVRADSTLSHEGQTWQIDASFLCKKYVTVASCLLDQPPVPWVEHKELVYPLHPVDLAANACFKREAIEHKELPKIDFDPTKTLVDKATGRSIPYKKELR